MGAIFSFLGGSAFRLIFGEVAAFFTKAQDHKYELERLKFQAEVDAAQHERNLAAIKIQADLQVKVIEVQSNADLGKIDASAWSEAVSAVGRSTGIKFLDAWNGTIRPFLATMATFMLILQFVSDGYVLTPILSEVVFAIIGIYLADRQLAKRGK